MALDLVACITICTAPKQSYPNPAESVISTLNLGPQNVATTKVSVGPEKGIKMKSLGTLKKISNAAKRDPSMSDNLEASIKSV